MWYCNLHGGGCDGTDDGGRGGSYVMVDKMIGGNGLIKNILLDNGDSYNGSLGAGDVCTGGSICSDIEWTMVLVDDDCSGNNGNGKKDNDDVLVIVI
jgi:hypothetical protein